jgi:hypothetical protein
VFDAPNSLTTCTRRNRSTTPQQALTLANDQAFFELAEGLADRLLREVPADYLYEGEGPGATRTPVYANVAHLDFKRINMVIAIAALGFCLGYVGLMPRQRLRSTHTDSIEYAMLLVMMTIFSPISWFYYGVWLLYPYIVAISFLFESEPSRRAKKVALIWLATCVLLLNFVYPWVWIRPVRAIGLAFFGYVLLLAGLGWLLWRARRAAVDAAA